MANISVQHLVKDFSRADHGTLQVIGDLTFDVRDGEFISILGPSGCGKSTLLSILAGLDQPSHGEILVNGNPLRRNGNQTRLGFVFQQPRLLNGLIGPAFIVKLEECFGPMGLLQFMKIIEIGSTASF